MDREYTFRGTFPCAVDQKRRLTVPSRFAKALTPRAKRTFVAVQGLERCLSLYPVDYWATFERNLIKARFSDAKTRRGIRKLLASAEDVPIDGQNRMTLTPRMLGIARVTKKAVLNGVVDHLELWSPEGWDDFLNEDGAPTFEETFTSFEDIMHETALQITEEREQSADDEAET